MIDLFRYVARLTTTHLQTSHSDVKLTLHSDDTLAAAGNALQVAQEANGWIRFDLTTSSRLGWSMEMRRPWRSFSGDATIPADHATTRSDHSVTAMNCLSTNEQRRPLGVASIISVAKRLCDRRLGNRTTLTLILTLTWPYRRLNGLSSKRPHSIISPIDFTTLSTVYHCHWSHCSQYARSATLRW